MLYHTTRYVFLFSVQYYTHKTLLTHYCQECIYNVKISNYNNLLEFNANINISQKHMLRKQTEDKSYFSRGSRCRIDFGTE